MLLIFLLAVAVALDPRELEKGLQSAEGQVKLFSSWMKQEGNQYDNPQEKSFRFRVFRSHLKEIVEINAAQDMYTLDANFMAGLTDEEQKMYYGINITENPVEDSILLQVDEDHKWDRITMPTAVDWRAQGKVGVVKHQGGCGSCWAFAGTASFEGHYAIKSGGLKRFSEQEMLDCTYESQRGKDGCKGGWYWLSFDMIKRTQHLSLEADYSYTGRDGRCLTSSKKNGMVAARSKGTARPRKSANDASLATALNVGPVSMAFEIKGGFSYYKTGILSVNYCGSTPHHAMAVTGYTSSYFEIKNSWGGRWGDRGYVKFDRRIQNMCGISNWLAYPILEKTGDDTDDDVKPTSDDGGDDTCVDKNNSCNEWANRNPSECTENWQYMTANCRKSCGLCGCGDASTKCGGWKSKGYCSTGGYVGFMKAVCPKTCGHCEGGDNKCPAGLTFCNGKCQHEHFC